MLQGIFITSTGTGIGKTLVTSALCYQLKSEARNRKPEEKGNSSGVGTNSQVPLPFTGGARGGHLSSFGSINTSPPLIPFVPGRETSNEYSRQQTTWEVTDNYQDIDKDIFGFKPLATGFREDDYTSDTWQIIASQGLDFTMDYINIVSPFRFAAPLSPNMAASREGESITAAMLADYCCAGQQVKEDFLAPSLTLPRKRERGYRANCSVVPSPVLALAKPLAIQEPVARAVGVARYGGGLGRGHSSYLGTNVYKIIEGIGGVMTPLNGHETVLDWVELLATPVLLVTGSYLGSLSHTLSAYEVLRARGLTVKAIIVSETENSSVPLQETAATIEQHTKANVFALPRISDSATKWMDVPPLLHLL